MKKFNFIYGVVAASMLFSASCSNDYPGFDDADAFIAFAGNTALSVDEFGKSIEVPAMLTSLAGLSGTATIEVVDSLTTAKEGVDFSFEGGKTMNFTSEAPLQTIKLNIIDNNEFGNGDKKIVLQLTNVTGVNLGAVSTCTITIVDDEHPLNFLFNTYTVKTVSYFGKEISWEMYITKDDTDMKKIWLNNLSGSFLQLGYGAPSVNYFYGIVNDDNTQITIPTSQEVGLSTDGVKITLEGFTGADPDTSDIMSSGQSITVNIEDKGNKLVFVEAWGTTAAGDGWWDLYYGGLQMFKK